MEHRRYKDYHKEENGILYKKCIDCEEWLEANLDNFGKNKNTKSGFSQKCRKCNHKSSHERYLLNKDKYKENVAKRIANNEIYNREFNDYIIDDKITKIIMENKNGDKLYVIIDTDDLERVKSFGLRWSVKSTTDIRQKYARSSRWEIVDNEPKLITYCLHSLIANAKKGEYVDHINHNTLDNRKENLRITTNSNNTRHRKSKNSNNKSGYRNVCWIKSIGKWVVQLHLDGKNTRLGEFDDVHEAGRYAEEMRQKYYGEFAGKS